MVVPGALDSLKLAMQEAAALSPEQREAQLRVPGNLVLPNPVGTLREGPCASQPRRSMVGYGGHSVPQRLVPQID